MPNVKFHIDSTTCEFRSSNYFWTHNPADLLSEPPLTLQNTGNETSIQEALGDHPTGFHVYAASKALSEKAIWKFFEDEKLSFRFVPLFLLFLLLYWSLFDSWDWRNSRLEF